MTETFAISYGAAFKPLAVGTGIGPGRSGVELDEAKLRVRMGWAFKAEIPRASIVSATRGEDVAATRGVHGYGGAWLVNGDGKGIVELRLDPPARARMSGVPIKLERLRVSLNDPDAFLSALAV